MTLVFKIYPILDVKRNESGPLYKAACLKTGYRNKEKYIFVLNRGGTPLFKLPFRALGGLI